MTRGRDHLRLGEEHRVPDDLRLRTGEALDILAGPRATRASDRCCRCSVVDCDVTILSDGVRDEALTPPSRRRCSQSLDQLRPPANKHERHHQTEEPVLFQKPAVPSPLRLFLLCIARDLPPFRTRISTPPLFCVWPAPASGGSRPAFKKR